MRVTSQGASCGRCLCRFAFPELLSGLGLPGTVGKPDTSHEGAVFPLSFHQSAVSAARAVPCGGVVGEDAGEPAFHPVCDIRHLTDDVAEDVFDQRQTRRIPKRPRKTVSYPVILRMYDTEPVADEACEPMRGILSFPGSAKPPKLRKRQPASRSACPRLRPGDMLDLTLTGHAGGRLSILYKIWRGIPEVSIGPA